MTPDPWVKRQGFVLAFVGLVLGLTGQIVAAAVSAALTIAVWVPLLVAYRSKRRAFTPTTTAAVAERASLDRLMKRVSLLVIVTPLAASAVSVESGIGIDQGVVSSGIAGSVLFLVGGVYWSSLVDWYWVLPRISGLYGHRSCRINPDAGAKAVSREGVTRWWLTHRIVSAIAVAIGTTGLLATVGAGVAATAGANSIAQAMFGALGAFIGAGITVYRRFSAAGFPLAMRPEIYVGASYQDRELGPVWPVDVSLEGFGLVAEADHKRRLLAHHVDDGPLFYHRKSDATVLLSDVVARRSGDAVVCCDAASCSGLSWYCIENPLAWSKPPGQ